MRNILFNIALFSSSFFVTPTVLAATRYCSTGVPAGVVPVTSIGLLVGNVFSFVVVVASVLLFLYLILGGIQWLTSGGDKAGTQAARDRITAALTGLLIILAVWGVMVIVEAAFGISLIGGISFPSAPTQNKFTATGTCI